MVVRCDDIIIAGSGDDLDWLSQKLNEKVELVQERLIETRMRPRDNSVGISV